MNEHPEQEAEKRTASNSREEAAAASSSTEKRRIQKLGHRGLLTEEQGAKMEHLTTARATYVLPRGPAVRLTGRRRENLEQNIARTIREQIELQMKSPPRDPVSCCSVTHESFSVAGFVPLTERLTPVHDYTSEPSVTFWSENHQHIQGVTPVRSPGAPFRKCSQFSRPIGERVDDPAPPPED
ncbi:sperm associated antigen 8 [Boleophthalmus pectinirostris]|uniref:sperm associated antigen 8 n=1 Tax=Boleophthalmus pectinirostris TaxID=150288 RepID=UPI00242EC03B|nr:sperm associated antigen 8 [Boleophthalmus pectinirostris]